MMPVESWPSGDMTDTTSEHTHRGETKRPPKRRALAQTGDEEFEIQNLQPLTMNEGASGGRSISVKITAWEEFLGLFARMSGGRPDAFAVWCDSSTGVSFVRIGQ